MAKVIQFRGEDAVARGAKRPGAAPARLPVGHSEQSFATARKPGGHPARRATDFPTDSTAVRAKNRPADAVIQERTGKSWRDWFFLLNSSGVEREERQKVIAANTDANSQWRNVVLIAYELDLGMREQYVKPGGYEVSISRTVKAPVAGLFALWLEDDLRRGWLGSNEITISKVTANKSILIDWEDGTTSLSVEFYSPDPGKTRVVVQHSKLPQIRVPGMKVFWNRALKDLKAAAETRSPASPP